MNVKGKPLPKGFQTADDFVEPPEAKEEDPVPKDPEPVKEFSMKGSELKFAFDLLCVLNAHKLAERQKIRIPNNPMYRHGLSPEKVVEVLGFIADIDIELFSKHDFFNANVSMRVSTLTAVGGAVHDTDFPVEPLVRTFIPEEFSDEAKARVFQMHMAIFTAIAEKRVRPEDVVADPDQPLTPTGTPNPF